MEKEDILLENIKEYYKYCLEAFKNSNFNTAATLFFKTLAALCDLFLFRKEGRIPSSHTERFRILELKYLSTYRIIDRDFPFYRTAIQKSLIKNPQS